MSSSTRNDEEPNGTVVNQDTGLMWKKEPESATLSFIEAMHSISFAGYTDWRLPSTDEIKSIQSALQYFTNKKGFYWTSSRIKTNDYFHNYCEIINESGLTRICNPEKSENYLVRYVRSLKSEKFHEEINSTELLNSDEIQTSPKTTNNIRVRPISPQKYDPNFRFIDNNDGTIFDQSTRLIWIKNREPDKLTISKALKLSKFFAGSNEWRLPSSDEIKSISPIDEKYFPPPTRGYYLSSTYRNNKNINERNSYNLVTSAGMMDYLIEDSCREEFVRFVRFMDSFPLSTKTSGNGLGYISCTVLTGAESSNPKVDGYTAGSTIELRVLPAKGSSFNRWHGDLETTNNLYIITIDAPKSIIADFQLITYPLALEITGSGVGTINPSIQADAYPHGTVLSLTATAGARSKFKQWGGDVWGSDPNTSIIIDGNKSVTAEFVRLHPLNISTTGQGQGLVQRSFQADAYEMGSSVGLTALPANGHSFVGWHGDATGSEAHCILIMDSPKFISAEFEMITYPLALEITGSGVGTINPSIQADAYPHGTVLSLTATAGARSKFKQWGGDAKGVSPETTITIDGSKLVTAEFVQFYPLSVSTTGQGQGLVRRNVQADAYEIDSTVVLTAVPAEGHLFMGWHGDATGTESRGTLRMNAPKSIAAQFEPLTYSLTLEKIGSGVGTITPSSQADVYPYGTVLLLTATAAGIGSKFKQWGGDAKGVSPETTITIDGSKLVTAEFVQLYPLSVATVGQGLVQRSVQADAYDLGSVVELTAIPAQDHLFVGWQGDASGEQPTCSVHMDAAKAVTAEFMPKPSFNVYVACVGTGSGTALPATQKHWQGSVVELVAEAEIGSVFDGWEGDISGFEPRCSVTVNADLAITARFSRVDLPDTDISVAFDGITSYTSTDGDDVTVLLFNVSNQSERQIRIDVPLADYVTLHGEEVTQLAWQQGMINGDQGSTLRSGAFRKMGLVFDRLRLPALQAGEHLHLTLQQSKPALQLHMSFRCTDSISRDFSLVKVSIEKMAAAPVEEASEEPAATAWTSRMQQMEQEMQEALSKLNAAAAAAAAIPPPIPSLPIPQAPPATPPAAGQTLLEVLAWLCTQNQVPVALLRQKLLPLDLMPSAVIDDVNERSFDVAGEAALDEAEDAVTVQRGVLLQVLAAW